MPDYQKMYSTLFNEVTTAIQFLQAAQQKVEDIYVASDEEQGVLTENEKAAK